MGVCEKGKTKHENIISVKKKKKLYAIKCVDMLRPNLIKKK